jgi:hypothetical protein
MASAAKRPVSRDPTHYPVDEKMGEGSLQRFISELLRPLLARFLAERGERAFVGADQFIYWVQHEPTRSVAPDVYVLPGVDPEIEIDCWKVWETEVVPSFAFEVVSRDVRKDYEVTPTRYAELGTGELIIFDPKFDVGADRSRWQVYRREPRRGFVRIVTTNADRVRSMVLGCWLRSVGEGAATRVRLAVGPSGDDLVPTDAELAAGAREAKRRGQIAEAEAARLRAEIARLRRK